MSNASLKLICTYFVCFILVDSIKAQSGASATISATIVNPIGTESISPTASETSLDNIVFLDSISKTMVKEPGGTHFTKLQIAAIKLWNNNYSFDVITAKQLFMKERNGKGAFSIDNIASSHRNGESQDNSSIISIIASIDVPVHQASGIYKSSTPWDVIISFE